MEGLHVMGTSLPTLPQITRRWARVGGRLIGSGILEEPLEVVPLRRILSHDGLELERAQVALCLFDLSEGFTAQDTHVVGYALDAFRGVVVVANKWDLVKDGVLKEYSARVIPEGGFKALPKLFAPGVLVVGSAAGFVINNGFSLI